MSAALQTVPLPDSVSTDDQILATQVRLMVEQSRAGQRAVPVTALLLGFMFQPAAGWGLYLAWLGCVLIFFVLRALLLNRAHEQAAPPRRVARTVMLSTALIGLVTS